MNVIQLTPQSNRTRKMNSAVRERTLCCVALRCPNCQSALLIASFRFQFSEHVGVSVMKTAAASACRFVLLLLSYLGSINTFCIDWAISSIDSHSFLLSSSWCWSVHLFLVLYAFLRRSQCTHSHTNIEMWLSFIRSKCCVHLDQQFTVVSF